MDKCKKYLLVGLLGGVGYCIIEILWRGYTHWTMGIAGALGLLAICWIETHIPGQTLLYKALIGCLLLTGIELAAGLIINISFGLHVWDYSGVPGNFLGQICLSYSLLWFLLCLFVLPMISLMRKLLSYQYAEEN